jgi:putative tryptophan/tyrosine transport system substrate-binding protein
MQPDRPNRREVIALLGTAAAWPQPARAQQRLIGVLSGAAESDPQARAQQDAFVQALSERGWVNGRNVQVETRWGAGDAGRMLADARALVALTPEVILASGGVTMQALLQATRIVPIVFLQVLDPVGAGYVQSLARPGGNVTGFTNFEYGMSGKWLELIKQTKPDLTRAAVLRDPGATSGTAQFAAIQAVAPFVKVDLTAISLDDVGQIERDIAEFAQRSNGGLIVVPGARVVVHRELIAALATRHGLPAIYPYRYFAASGGLMSYGPDVLDQYRRAASYIDRILKGEKPADLPVQNPTKYELVINLKTAKVLGLEIPPLVLARADEVIE